MKRCTTFQAEINGGGWKQGIMQTKPFQSCDSLQAKPGK